MSRFVVVGAGATGSGVAVQLAEGGHEAVVVSRSGSGPRADGVRLVAVDAADRAALATLSAGAQAIFNCANPPYHRWPTDWPPIADALLDVAEGTGATLVTLGNLYPYGVPSGPMSPHDPFNPTCEKARVRGRMWEDALARHQEGRLRAVEVRASDFIGPGANAVLGDRAIPRILAGRSVQVVGDPDAPHSWTYVGDVATTLVACALDESSWGRAWHVPTDPPRSARQAVGDLADAAGVPHVKVTSVPSALLRLAGIFSPLMRELPKTLYQFEVEFVIDDAETRAHFGLGPTPWDRVLSETLAPFRSAGRREPSPR
jgi:nucleoside-diphosphate-sugar epimerase